MIDAMQTISINTPAEFLEHAHTLSLYCRACERWLDVDLQVLVAAGRGDQAIQRMRFKCKDCGAGMEKQVRPPSMQR